MGCDYSKKENKTKAGVKAARCENTWGDSCISKEM